MGCASSIPVSSTPVEGPCNEDMVEGRITSASLNMIAEIITASPFLADWIYEIREDKEAIKKKVSELKMYEEEEDDWMYSEEEEETPVEGSCNEKPCNPYDSLHQDMIEAYIAKVDKKTLVDIILDSPELAGLIYANRCDKDEIKNEVSIISEMQKMMMNLP